MTASGQLHALPRCSIAVRFTPVSGIDSRSQALPGRATTGREQMQQASGQGQSYSINAVEAITGLEASGRRRPLTALHNYSRN
jgi:hypothetical protein